MRRLRCREGELRWIEGHDGFRWLNAGKRNFGDYQANPLLSLIVNQESLL